LNFTLENRSRGLPGIYRDGRRGKSDFGHGTEFGVSFKDTSAAGDFGDFDALVF